MNHAMFYSKEPTVLVSPMKCLPCLFLYYTFFKAAERIINNHVPSDFSVQFLSNAPSGVYRRAERDGLPTNTPKVCNRIIKELLDKTIH